MTDAYLYTASFASALHPRGDIDSVPPDIVVRLLSADDAGCDGTVVHSHAQNEVIERLLVDGCQHSLQLESELYQAHEVLPS